jgi:hypothetical protein
MTEKDIDRIRRYYLEQLSEDEIDQLEKDLQTSRELRQAFVDMSVVETQLRTLAIESKAEKVHPTIRERKSTWIPHIVLAASIFICIGLFLLLSQDNSIAILKSSEYASWESELPTIPGSKLNEGKMYLKEGFATLVFESGAELSIEGPTRLNLISDMKAMVQFGIVTVFAPESAKGFELQTPFGDAIDYGTEFTVKVNETEQTSNFWVNQGEIAVLSKEGKTFQLKDREQKSLGLKSSNAIDPLKEGHFHQTENSSLTFSPQGFEKSIVRMDDIKGRIDPKFLMLKNQKVKDHVDRKAFFAFHIPHKKRKALHQASITLNYVPSGLGTIVDMPKESTFILYAFSNNFDKSWPKSMSYWKDAPNFDQAKEVAKFKIPRAQLRKTITINTPELKNYLEFHTSDKLSFALVCETKGASYVHCFASSLHPQASGPLLKLKFPSMM